MSSAAHLLSDMRLRGGVCVRVCVCVCVCVCVRGVSGGYEGAAYKMRESAALEEQM